MRERFAALIVISFFGFGADIVNFDGLKPGTLPPFWTTTATHPSVHGPASRWEVTRDRTAPSHQTVFGQVHSGVSDSEFPLAVYDKATVRDGDLSVKFKITGGRRFKTAGMVWRYQDPDNYYLLHFSVDESNIVLFRVQDGKARAIPVVGGKPGAFGVAHNVRAGQWYVAKVSYRGQRFKVSFGNRKLFEAVDGSISTEGKTGILTKGGTTAEFDDFRIDKKS